MGSPPTQRLHEAQRETASRYRRLFETAQDGILLLNAESAEIEDINPCLIDMLGYPPAAFLGKKLWDIYAFAEMAQSKDMFKLLQTDGYVRYDDLSLITATGEHISVKFIGNTYDCDGIQLIQCNIRDISERKADEAKIQRHIHLYAALSECNKAIVHCTSQDVLFQKICRAAVEYGGMRLAWIGLIDTETHMVKPVASFGDNTEFLKDITISTDADSPFGCGPTGTAIREDRLYWCQDYQNDPAVPVHLHECAKNAGLASTAALPLHFSGNVIGVFSLHSSELNAFDKATRELLTEMAMDISFAIDNFAHIAQRKQSDAALKNMAMRYHTVFELSADAIMLLSDKVFFDCNEATLQLFGCATRDDFISKHPAELSPPTQPGGVDSMVLADERIAVAFKNGHNRFEWRHRRLDGTDFPAEVLLTSMQLSDKTVLQAVVRDITERKQAEDKVEQLAFYDPLTGLPNRRLLLDRLQQNLRASARHPNHDAVLFIDLDNFKVLNDTRGHSIGDLLLIEVANRLLTCVRSEDSVARLGGDEFVILLSKLSENPIQAANQADITCEKILSEISQPYFLSGSEYHTSASIGICMFRDQEATIDELLQRADTAMYQAKSYGRNTLRFYDPVMQAELQARTLLDNDLRHALAENQFKLYYQMQVNDKGQILGAEVLLRWQHPHRGLVAPLEFIPLAEENGLIIPIGQWVLETACAQLKAWEARPVTNKLRLAVNVSARQFHQTNFVEQVSTALHICDCDPKLLSLELTESLVMDNIVDTVIKMEALRKLGVSFSIDDFGTGYSSLSYLTQLPLDQLKIDQSFVRNIAVKHNDGVIIQTIIGMAHSLGIEVIAEGVETKQQYTFLKQHDCLHYQGYFFSRPLPIDEFETRLKP